MPWAICRVNGRNCVILSWIEFYYQQYQRYTGIICLVYSLHSQKLQKIMHK